MKQPFKTLLIFSYDFPPSTGGISRLCHEIVTHMQAFYKKVHVLTIQKEGQAIPYQENPKVDITYLPKQRLKAEMKALNFLRNWSNKENTDLLCGIWHPEATLAITAGMHNIFVLAHGTELLAGNSKFRKYLWHPIYAKWVFGRVKRVIANSHYTQNLVKQINLKAKTVTLPLGVNPDFFKPTDTDTDTYTDIDTETKKLKICTVSRILKFKGHDFILETLENLPSDYRSLVEWHIAGTGFYLEDLKILATKSKISKQVYFHGFVADKDLAFFYSRHNIFILATREEELSTQVEGFGLVFLEAQACGVPVVGTNTGGIPDAIDHENGGWLIDQDDKANLTSLIKSLIDNPHIIKKQSLLARKRVIDKANWEAYTNKLNTILS
jgi:phosphatidylinositol alpha-1,6-mannosyltransferase